MDDITKELLVNRLTWDIQGTYFRDEDLEKCVNKSHIKRKSEREAHSRAGKIVDAYAEDNPTQRQKRGYRNSETIWERRFDEELGDVIEEYIAEIDEHGMTEQAKFLMTP